MYLQPVVRCKNPDCPMPSLSRIRLPYSAGARVGAAPANWPDDEWELRLICRECDHWYVYQKKDVEWSPFTSTLAEHSNLDFWQADLECAEPGCNSLTHWHVLDNSQLSEEDLLDFVLRADPVVVCENGHPLVGGTKSKSAKKVAQV